MRQQKLQETRFVMRPVTRPPVTRPPVIDLTTASEEPPRKKRREAVIDLTEEDEDEADPPIEKSARVTIAEEEEGLECGCCFSDVPLSEVVQCTEGDIFCVGCLRRYAEESVFGSGKASLEFPCMSMGTCTGNYPESELRKALTAKQLAKLAQTAAVAAARSASVELFSCPKCGVAAEVRPGGLSFECPQTACTLKCCRQCAKPPHAGPCEEDDSPSETKRKVVEEAMTKARLRQCPKCAAKFFKSDGCNKMTCACGQLVCYVCSAGISTQVGYAHFCQTPHCDHKRCNKCVLYSDASEDHHAMRRAAVANHGEEREIDALLEQAPAPVVARRGGPPFVNFQDAIDRARQYMFQQQRAGPPQAAPAAAGRGALRRQPQQRAAAGPPQAAPVAVGRGGIRRQPQQRAAAGPPHPHGPVAVGRAAIRRQPQLVAQRQFQPDARGVIRRKLPQPAAHQPNPQAAQDHHPPPHRRPRQHQRR